MSMFDMLQNFPQQQEALMKTLDHTKVSHNMNIVPQKTISQQVNAVEAMPTMFKDKVEVSPFFLSIKIYGKNLSNCFVNLGASCNIMTLSIAQMLGVSPQPSNRVVIQLDKIEVKVIGVLEDVQIQLTIDPWIQGVIDIHVVDIPEQYGFLLSREWMKCLRGWFSTNFTQLWLSWKGLNNQIKIDVEPKLKIMIIEYNALNEITFLQSDLGS